LDQVEITLQLLRESKIELASRATSHAGSASIISTQTLLIGNKSDLDLAEEDLNILKEFFAGQFEIHSISALLGSGIETLRGRIFEILEIIRIYSKPPGKKINLNDPFVLRKGSTVVDAAAMIHKDFAENLKFARIWGSEKFEGQMVHRDHLLQDGDVVEFHI
jgi:ribosome-interacting GTPase 1